MTSLAGVLCEGECSREAAEDAKQLLRSVLVVEPNQWDAWANLANIITDAPQEAAHAFRRAIVELERSSEPSAGEALPAEADQLARLYYGYARQLHQLHLDQENTACEALTAETHRAARKGKRQSAKGGRRVSQPSDGAACYSQALEALRSAMRHNPTHTLAAHMLAALGAEGGEASTHPPPSSAAPAVVEALFDQNADTFDEKLAALQYLVPEVLGEMTAAHVRDVRSGQPFATALDAGCGTGLLGPYIRPLVAGHLSGVDLSKKMLDKAATRTSAGDDGVDTMTGRLIYDSLLARDLVALRRPDVLPEALAEAGIELVTAADVLVYFGALDELLRTFSDLASASSVLICSCELALADQVPSGWTLLKSGRYAHTKEYVTGLAARIGGFKLAAYKEIIARMESGIPVRSQVFVFLR